ncbi:MAG: asparagine synthase-related protein [Rhodospirillales bacterium]
MRQWLAKALPKARANAPKQGFTVPVGAWIGNHGGRLGDLVSALPCVQEVADPDRVRALFRAAAGRRQSLAAWSLLFYALWHRAISRRCQAMGMCLRRWDKGKSKARALPWTRWGLRPQTPTHWGERRSQNAMRTGFAGGTPSIINGVWGLLAPAGSRAEPWPSSSTSSAA